MTVSVFSPPFAQRGIGRERSAQESGDSVGQRMDGAAWKREMERAEMAGWLANPAPAMNFDARMNFASIDSAQWPISEKTGLSEPAGDCQIHALQPNENQAPVVAPDNSTTVLNMTAAEEVSGGAFGQDKFWPRLPELSAVAAAKENALEGIPGQIQALMKSTSSLVKEADVRVTVSAEDDDVHLWIGIDEADDNFSDSGQETILSQARQAVESEGRRLASVTLNGKSIYPISKARSQSSSYNLAATAARSGPILYFEKREK